MPRGFGLSEVTKDAIWMLRAQGLSDREVGRRLGLARGSVSNHLARTGGIRPSARRRPERCLSFEEREEVSRAIAGGQSARAIARALGRSHTTIAREIDRCGGRRRYRAHAAERAAWRRSRRPRATRLELCPELCRVVEERLGEDHSPEQIARSEEHTSELQSPDHLVCRLLLEKKKKPTSAKNPAYNISEIGE